jgi:hypothetical protein
MNTQTYQLDAYEQEILDAFDAGTLKPVPTSAEEIKWLQQCAKETLARMRSEASNSTAVPH